MPGPSFLHSTGLLLKAVCVLLLPAGPLIAQSPPPPRTVAESQVLSNGPSQEETGVQMTFRRNLWGKRDKFSPAITAIDQELPVIFDLFRAGGTNGGIDYLTSDSGVDSLINAEKLVNTWKELSAEGARRSKLCLGVLQSCEAQAPEDAVKALDGLNKTWVTIQGVNPEPLSMLFRYRWVLLYYAKDCLKFHEYFIAYLKERVRLMDERIDLALKQGGPEGRKIIERTRQEYRAYIAALKTRLVRNKNHDQRYNNMREPVKNCLNLAPPDAALFPGYAGAMSHWKNYAGRTVDDVNQYLEALTKYDVGREEVARSITEGSRHFKGRSFMDRDAVDAVFVEALRQIK